LPPIPEGGLRVCLPKIVSEPCRSPKNSEPCLQPQKEGFESCLRSPKDLEPCLRPGRRDSGTCQARKEGFESCLRPGRRDSGTCLQTRKEGFESCLRSPKDSEPCLRPRKKGFGVLPSAQGDADFGGIVSACQVIELPRLSMRLGSRPGVFWPTVYAAGAELLGPSVTESLRPGEVDSGDNLVQVLLAGEVPAPTSRRQLLVARIRHATTVAA
jgi:hypothetical protein